MNSEKLAQAVQHIKSGNKIAALPILKEIVQAESDNENAWLWLHSCVEKVEQKKYCLQQALRINPNNQEARNALLNLGNHMPINIQSTHAQVDPSTLSSVGRRQCSENSPTQYQTKGSTTRKSVLPSLTIFVISACLILLLLAILIVKPSIGSQIFTLFQEKAYSSSMKPVLDELQVWFNGPVKQFERDVASPYGHGNSSYYPNGYTLLAVINLYDIMPDMLRVAGVPSWQIDEIQQETRANLAENLFPSLNAIKQDGFVIVTKLRGINPPDSIKVAHERVASCVEYKVELANTMIVFLNTGNDSNLPTGDCNFFEESLLMISDFIK